ncbi:MAG: S8 family peptidase [Amaricoccus sp.]
MNSVNEIAKSRIAGDLQAVMPAPDGAKIRVIVEFDANYPGGEGAARAMLLIHVLKLPEVKIDDVRRPSWYAIAPFLEGVEFAGTPPEIVEDDLELYNSLLTEKYLFAELDADTIRRLADLKARVPKIEGGKTAEGFGEFNLVYKIWRDSPIEPTVYVSSRTVKSDAARVAFKSGGRGVVWAVADTGIRRHPHFLKYGNLDLSDGLRHWDFTQKSQDPKASADGALTDTVGHGTHVAGIIAGATVAEKGRRKQDRRTIRITRMQRSNEQLPPEDIVPPSEIVSLAPECKLLSLKVLANRDGGQVSRVLAAIGYIQLLNGYGRHLKVHGVNISLGYQVDPASYGAGQSPLCREVDRLVKSGVVVVVAAGNGGSSPQQTEGVVVQTSNVSSIADPGNAELAITVGSTHRDRPLTYGVSFFSAKGPTSDGRMKPDVVAPGELIVSCSIDDPGDPTVALFREDTGTSMAAPHVSGAVAAFLSVRREFQGRPEEVKALFMGNATSLGRRPEYQGAGLIDLMRTLQAV